MCRPRIVRSSAVFSQFQKPLGYRLRFGRRPNEARDHRRQIVPSVEAVFEFGEVPRDALAIDRAIGSGDCSLNIAARGIDLFEGWRAGRLKTLKPVADNGAVQVEAAPGEPSDRGGTELVIWRSFSRTGFPAAVVPTAAYRDH